MSVRRRAIVAASIALTVGLAAAPDADAAWSNSGSGQGRSLADTMPTAGAPSARPALTSVTVSWAPVQFPDGSTVAGYLVHRFNAVTGAESTVAAGCSGRLTVDTCTEFGVPSGTWTYAVATVQNSWTGAEGPSSSVVTIP